jgi:phosphatidylglycerophosphate synthase
VSYVRKQAEASGIECKVGFATRDIRNLIIILAIIFQIFYSNSIYYFFIILVIITYFTVIQRAVYTFKKINCR